MVRKLKGWTQQQIDEIWVEKYRDSIGIPAEIIDLKDENLKNKLCSAWIFIHCVFGEEIAKETGIKQSQLKHALYDWVTNSFYEQLGGVTGMVNWFAAKELLTIFERQTVENFVKREAKNDNKS